MFDEWLTCPSQCSSNLLQTSAIPLRQSGITNAKSKDANSARKGRRERQLLIPNSSPARSATHRLNIFVTVPSEFIATHPDMNPNPYGWKIGYTSDTIPQPTCTCNNLQREINGSEIRFRDRYRQLKSPHHCGPDQSSIVQREFPFQTDHD